MFNPWIGKIPWRRERLPIPVFWPGEFHGLYSRGVTKSQTRLSDFHFQFVGFYRVPSSAACFSFFSFCLIYCIWGVLSADCKAVVPLICGFCPQWVEMDKCPWRFLVWRDCCLCSVGWSWILSLWRAVLNTVLFWGVCGLGMALGSLCVNGQCRLPILLMIWRVSSSPGSLLAFEWAQALVQWWRPLGGLSPVNVPWGGSSLVV